MPGIKVTYDVSPFSFIFFFQIKNCSVLITSWQWWLKWLLSLLYMHYGQFWKCLAPIQKILWHIYNSGDSSGSGVGCCKIRKLSRGEAQTFWRSRRTGRLTEGNIAHTSNIQRACDQKYKPICILCYLRTYVPIKHSLEGTDTAFHLNMLSLIHCIFAHIYIYI